MNVVSYCLLFSSCLLIWSCSEKGAEKEPQQTSNETRHKTYHDWVGTYVGVLPCTDCDGLETILTLARDHSFRLITTRLGKGEQASIKTGKYAWNQDSTIITLDQGPSQYEHHINGLYQLGPEGKRMTGPDAEKYKLTRTMESMLAQYRWNLIELLGSYFEGSSAHIRFDDAGRMINGYAWCSTFEGSYEIISQNEVQFGEMLAFKEKTCPDSTIEKQFLNMFSAVNRYRLEKGVLSLSRGDNEPMAKFRASSRTRR